MNASPEPSHHRMLTVRSNIEENAAPQGQSYNEVSTTSNLHNYFDLFRRRKWAVVFPLFMTACIVGLGIFYQKPLYKAKTTILIKNNNPSILSIEKSWDQQKSQRTEVELLGDRILIEQVVDLLNLENYDSEIDFQNNHNEPTVLANLRRSIDHFIEQTAVPTIKTLINSVASSLYRLLSMPDTQELYRLLSMPDTQELYRHEVIEEFQESLQVIPREDSDLIDIVLSGNDPHETAKRLNTLVDVYIQNNLNNKRRDIHREITWLRSEAEKLKQKMLESTSALQKFRANKNLIGVSNQDREDISVQNYRDLNTKALSLRKEIILLETHIKNLEDVSQNDLNLNPSVLKSTSTQELYNTYVIMKSQLEKLSNTYKEKHPKIVNLSTEIQKIRNSISDILKEKYRLLISEQSQIRRTLSRYRDRVMRYENSIEEYTALKNEFDTNKNLYLDTYKKLKELTMLHESGSNNVTIVRRASAPLYPVPSGNIYKILLSIIVGLGIGVAFAFTSDYFDRRFKKVEEVESYLQLPLLSIIPKHKVARQKFYEPVFLQKPQSPESDAYRMLRTRIQPPSSASIRTLLVTSALPAEGKSTTVANLGISFAQFDQKVLLVDADLRRPSLHRHFLLLRDQGLADILVRGTDWREAIQDTSLMNLKVLPTGVWPQSSSELLHSKQMKQLIDNLRNNFDIIIFDAPIVLSIPDVEILASYIDAIILVHNPEKFDKTATWEAKKIIERARAPILGMVFNNIGTRRLKYYYSQKSYYLSSVVSSDMLNATSPIDIIDIQRGEDPEKTSHT